MLIIEKKGIILTGIINQKYQPFLVQLEACLGNISVVIELMITAS